jgi:hypothetical protein
MVVISSSAFVLVMLLYGIYWQLVKGEPWGDKPMSNSGLIIISTVSLVVVGFVIWLILNIKLEVKISAHEIQYRYYPHMSKWQALTPEEIEEYEVKKLGIFERGKRGYRGILMPNKRLIILGRYALKIKTKDGRKLTIGTQTPEDLKWAMKKWMKPEPGF